MFANHPELYVAMIFCEVMSARESISFEGFRKFFNNKGYGFDVVFDKDYKIDEPKFFSNP